MSAPVGNAEGFPRALAALAEAAGVATWYADATEQRVEVSPDAVRRVLTVLGFDVRDEAAASREVAQLAEAGWRRLVPPTVVLRADGPRAIRVVAAAGQDVHAELRLEDGTERAVTIGGEVIDRAVVDGSERVARTLVVPPDVPTGYHRLLVRAGTEEARALVALAPATCPAPDERAWGWMAQVYAIRSRDSWGLGGFRELREFARWSGEDLGAAFVLVNPLHAVAPVLPQENSPYFPTSRRFANPLYLEIPEIPEAATADERVRARLDALAEQLRPANTADRIDRDEVFRAKQEALALLYAVEAPPERREAFAAFCRREGGDLETFALFCALAERNGLPWSQWPEDLRAPDAPGVAAARDELADRVRFHMWQQWLCDEQLAAVQHAATAAGMPIGIVHDLAVGADPGGADAWAMQDALATGVSVGAPPDIFNQQGQNWSFPPLLPNRLAALEYRPFRDMLRSVLRHGGGIRIDHAMALFRLWWIPEGASAADGTYVRYPADDLIGILALEAERAGAVVVAEDLGTVEDVVRETFTDRAILRSQVLYFERTDDGEAPRPSRDYVELALASVTTHDLPSAAGWWAGEWLRIQTELGLLGADRSLADETARVTAEREELRQLLIDEGVADRDADADALLVAMHRFLGRTPCRLVAATVNDALGDLRQPNMPGTADEYPNWRLPIAEPVDDEHRPVLLEDLVTSPRVRRVVAALGRS